MTDQERQKAEEMISRLELSVGQVFPRDGGNAALLASMIQTLNGLRSLLGVVRPPETPATSQRPKFRHHISFIVSAGGHQCRPNTSVELVMAVLRTACHDQRPGAISAPRGSGSPT